MIRLLGFALTICYSLLLVSPAVNIISPDFSYVNNERSTSSPRDADDQGTSHKSLPHVHKSRSQGSYLPLKVSRSIFTTAAHLSFGQHVLSDNLQAYITSKKPGESSLFIRHCVLRL